MRARLPENAVSSFAITQDQLERHKEKAVPKRERKKEKRGRERERERKKNAAGRFVRKRNVT